MARNYSSVASEKTLSGDINTTATSMTLNNLTGLPTAPYVLVIDPDTASEEAVLVNSVTSGTTLSITRAIENNATASSHTTGAAVRHMIVGSDLQLSNDHMVASTAVHGLSAGVTVVGTTATQTLTNKTINLTSNTLTGTLAQFNTALSDTNFVSADGTETLTNKTLTSPTVSGLYLSDSSVVFEGSSADAFETTLTVTNPTADRTVTIPDTTGTVVTTGDTGTVATAMIADSAVTSAKIADGTIVNADINASAAIAATKISGTAITAADTGTVTSTMIADGTIVDADISGTAAIAWSKIAADTNNVYTNPTGMLAPFAGSTAPTGWLMCDGSPVSRTAYSALFALIGTTYGSGDGSTSFNVPDLRGRVIAGIDNMGGTDAGRLDWANTLGTSGGAQTHTLDSTEVPAHRHSWSYYDATSNTGDGGNSGARWDNSSDTQETLHTIYTTYVGGQTPGSAGTTAAHNNMQPTILLNYIIKH